MPNTPEKASNSMRIDKWLWCARFFKTRNLAATAVNGGKVTINGEKIKPSRMIQHGINLVLNIGAFRHEIEILAVTHTRKSAAEAALLYRETPESINNREKLAQQIKFDARQYPRSRGRPSKRDRRKLIKFKFDSNSD